MMCGLAPACRFSAFLYLSVFSARCTLTPLRCTRKTSAPRGARAMWCGPPHPPPRPVHPTPTQGQSQRQTKKPLRQVLSQTSSICCPHSAGFAEGKESRRPPFCTGTTERPRDATAVRAACARRAARPQPPPSRRYHSLASSPQSPRAAPLSALTARRRPSRRSRESSRSWPAAAAARPAARRQRGGRRRP